MDVVAKPVTERVKAHQARRAAEGRCLKESKDRKPPHGKPFKAKLCRRCYLDFLAYKRELRRKKREEGPG